MAHEGVSEPTVAGSEEEEKKAIALELLLDAWDEALAQGCSPELVATSAIFAAIADMVDLYGEEPVADMAAGLPERIRRGEFSMRDERPH